MELWAALCIWIGTFFGPLIVWGLWEWDPIGSYHNYQHKRLEKKAIEWDGGLALYPNNPEHWDMTYWEEQLDKAKYGPSGWKTAAEVFKWQCNAIIVNTERNCATCKNLLERAEYYSVKCYGKCRCMGADKWHDLETNCFLYNYDGIILEEVNEVLEIDNEPMFREVSEEEWENYMHPKETEEMDEDNRCEDCKKKGRSICMLNNAKAPELMNELRVTETHEPKEMTIHFKADWFFTGYNPGMGMHSITTTKATFELIKKMCEEAIQGLEELGE